MKSLLESRIVLFPHKSVTVLVTALILLLPSSKLAKATSLINADESKTSIAYLDNGSTYEPEITITKEDVYVQHSESISYTRLHNKDGKHDLKQGHHKIPVGKYRHSFAGVSYGKRIESKVTYQ